MHGTIDCMLYSVRPSVRPELEFVTYGRKVRLNWSKFFSLPSQEIGWEDRLRNYLFVSSGTLNLAPSILPSRSGEGHWVTHADIKGSRGRWTHPVSAIVAVSVVSSGVFIQAALGSMVKNRRKSNQAN